MDWTTIVGIVAGSLVVADVLLQWFSTRIVLQVFERELPLKVDPAEPDPSAETVTIPTAGGLNLCGSISRPVEGTPRGLIVFCPELHGRHFSAMSYCRGLLDAGFAVLGFEFRNQGESGAVAGYRPLHWVTEIELQDALAVLKYVESRDDLRDLPLGMMGVSRGGGTALAAAALTPKVGWIAVEGAFSTSALLLHYTLRWASLYVPEWCMRAIPLWHLRITLALTRWASGFRRGCRYPWIERLLPRLRGRDVLLISGKSDSYVPTEVAERLAARIGGNRCEVWAVRKARHNKARKVDPDAYDSRLVELFSRMDAGEASADADSPLDFRQHPDRDTVVNNHPEDVD